MEGPPTGGLNSSLSPGEEEETKRDRERERERERATPRAVVATLKARRACEVSITPLSTISAVVVLLAKQRLAATWSGALARSPRHLHAGSCSASS